jgi:hypothetical protein
METQHAVYGQSPTSGSPFLFVHLFTDTFAGTQSADGNTRTAGSNGALTIDGVSATVGMLVAYVPGTPSANAGIYSVTDAGSVSTPAILRRVATLEAGATFHAVRFTVLRGSAYGKFAGHLVSSATTGALCTVGTTTLAALAEKTQYGLKSYMDTSGSPGSATANAGSGRAAIAISASACTITNSLVGATSIVHATLEDLDATLTRIKVVPASGSFTVTGDATATAATKFRWSIERAD